MSVVSRGRRSWIAIGAALALTLAACGGDDDAVDAVTDAADDAADAAGDAAEDAAADAADAADDAADAAGDAADDAADAVDDAAGGSQGAGGGTLVLGDDTIQLDSARCYLQEQDAAAGGGKILFVAQGYGSMTDGEEFVLDVSRYDEDSQFAGDDMNLDIGDPFSDDAVSYRATGPIGTVTVDGSTVSADGVTFSNFDAGAELPGSFEINC